MQHKSNLEKIIVIVCRILIGLLFTFSGFVKAIDPWSSAIIFNDYFNAFHIGWLSPIGLILGISLSSVEFLVGVHLLANVRVRLASLLAFAMMVFFTFLTFILAVFNPVSDCGCFGDAIKMTNWQTFFKNLFFIVPAFGLFWKTKKLDFEKNSYKNIAQSAFFFLTIIGLSLYCYFHLPIIDFLPYKIGNNIPDLMIIPANAEQTVYQTTFIYEKEGVKKEFTLENYPASDSSWVFVDSKSIVIKEGYQPPIHDLYVESIINGDITAKILENEQPVFLFIAPQLEDISKEQLAQVNDLSVFCQSKNYAFYCLTTALQSDIDKFKSQNGAVFEFAQMDATALKSIIRAHVGLVLLQKGTIIGKWNSIDFPTIEQLNNPVAFAIKENENKKAELFTVLFFFLLIIGSTTIINLNIFKN